MGHLCVVIVFVFDRIVIRLFFPYGTFFCAHTHLIIGGGQYVIFKSDTFRVNSTHLLNIILLLNGLHTKHQQQQEQSLSRKLLLGHYYLSMRDGVRENKGMEKLFRLVLMFSEFHWAGTRVWHMNAHDARQQSIAGNKKTQGRRVKTGKRNCENALMNRWMHEKCKLNWWIYWMNVLVAAHLHPRVIEISFYLPHFLEHSFTHSLACPVIYVYLFVCILWHFSFFSSVQCI